MANKVQKREAKNYLLYSVALISSIFKHNNFTFGRWLFPQTFQIDSPK